MKSETANRSNRKMRSRRILVLPLLLLQLICICQVAQSLPDIIKIGEWPKMNAIGTSCRCSSTNI